MNIEGKNKFVTISPFSIEKPVEIIPEKLIEMQEEKDYINIETEYYHIEVNRNGTITSLYDKQSKLELARKYI